MKRLILPSLLAALAVLPTACKPKAIVIPPQPGADAATSTPAADQAASQASAAPANPGGNRPGGGGNGGGGQGNFQQRAAERMERMKTELGLTDDQAQKIAAITEQQFGSLRENMQSMSREDRRAAFQKARDAANAQISQVLTPEQQPKWEAFQQEMQQRRGGGGGNRGPQ